MAAPQQLQDMPGLPSTALLPEPARDGPAPPLSAGPAMAPQETRAWPGTPLPALLPVDARRAPPPQAAARQDQPATLPAQAARPPDTGTPNMGAPEPIAPLPASELAAAAPPPALSPPSPAKPSAAQTPERPAQRVAAVTLRPAEAGPVPVSAARAPVQPAPPAPPSIHIGVVEVRAAPPPPQIVVPRAAHPASARSGNLSRAFGQRFGFGQS
jgi:hypothetical protein